MTNIINDCIVSTLEFILRNPAAFFSEADIQAIFYHNLSQLSPFDQLFDTGCTIGSKGKNISKKTYKTFLIHREYGLNIKNRPKSRADIVILNKDDISKIKDPINLKTEDNGYLEPDYIFEFGTDKSASSSSKLSEHLNNDLNKLKKAKIMGYLIHIQRNYLKGNEYQSNKDKHKEYAERLISKWQENKNNIKLLYFKVDIGGEERQIFKQGKIKMFNGQELKGINQTKIKNTIFNYISNK